MWVDNGGVRLHAIDNERDGSGVPVVTVPGMGEEADEYAWQLDELGDRRVVVVDVRGRGRSHAPDEGYTWQDHFGDVLAVMAATGIDRPVMIGYSRGSPYAIGAALHSPRGVRGLVVNDYQARQVGLGEGMADTLLQMTIRGRTTAERMSEHAVRGVAIASIEIPLWDRLAELDAPVLVLRGGKSWIVDDEAQAQYLAASPRVRIDTLPDRGHGLWSATDRTPYLAKLLPFLDEVDAAP